ncbi:MAG: hypothetical protein QM802_12800 [Agriterribacter sp.]
MKKKVVGKDKSNEQNPLKKNQNDFPDVKKIEKRIATENKKKLTEVPNNIPDEESNPASPVEVPERKEENEIE